MIGRILKQILGHGTRPKPSTIQTKPAVKTHLSHDKIDAPFRHLHSKRPGLGERIEQYIITGDGAEVLREIEIASPDFHRHPNNHQIPVAIKYLSWTFGGKPDAMIRYVHVRQAMRLHFKDGQSTKEEHRQQTPVAVRSLLETLIQADPRQMDQKDYQTQSADLITAITQLGGTEVDLMVYCLPANHNGYHRHGTRLLMNDTSPFWDSLSVASFVAALELCSNSARAHALQVFKDNPLVKRPEFLPYLFKQFESSAKTLRDNARHLLIHHDQTAVETSAVQALGAKKAIAREMAVQVLGNLATPSALEALAGQKEVEKSQTVQRAIEVFVQQPTAAEAQVEDGYIDCHGNHVPFAEFVPLIDDGNRPITGDVADQFHKVRDEIVAIEQKRYDASLKRWAENEKKGDAPLRPQVAERVGVLIDALNGDIPATAGPIYMALHLLRYAHGRKFAPLVEAIQPDLPLARIIPLSLCGHDVESVFHAYVMQAITDHKITLRQYLSYADPSRVLFGYSQTAEQRALPVDQRYLLTALNERRRYYNRSTRVVAGIWEVAASHLPLLKSALLTKDSDISGALKALQIIADFPTVPRDLVHPLLLTAIDARAKLRAPAQALLRDVPGIDDQLIAMLSDKRQNVRANAARFLADRGDTTALPALAKRLKSEKSELARADLISAITRLGGDTAPYLGRTALVEEAEGFVAKLPTAKVDWADLDQAPALFWADGTPADPVLLDGWLRLALKLNAPLGSPLFALYLDQLTPDSATKLANWVFCCWMAFDAGRGHAGTKGVLALTHRAPAVQSTAAISAYLKKHGRYVSQCKALVETLYAMETDEAVQVLVATATRFKQQSVRTLAQTLVQALAEQRSWTQDEMADRSVPTGGFENDGTMTLDVGEDPKTYVAKLGSDLSVSLYNPSGKVIKTIPTGQDDNTKQSKSLLSAAKKSIKTITTQQQNRLHEAMVRARVWDRQAWQDDLTSHPIMQRLTQRIIWRGLDQDGGLVTTFRPTPEGDVLNANGDDVDLGTIAQIDIAHTANIDADLRAAWLQHFRDFEVTALFEQITRPLQTLSKDQQTLTKLEDRKGWVTTTFKLRAAAKKLGYDRGPILDAGWFDCYRKEFRSLGLWADLHFTGSNGGGEEDIPAALHHMQLTPIDSHSGQQLGKAPSILLSEVWNDMHDIAAVAAFDADWEKKTAY